VSRAEALLAAALAVVLLTYVSLKPDYTRRNVEFLPDMVTSPAYESQAPCPAFPDGKTLQRPPAGTIARGFLPLEVDGVLLDVRTPYKELPPEQVGLWDRLPPPWAGKEPDALAAQADLARGSFVFTNFCAVCHGPAGAGDGPVTKLGVPPPTPLTGDGAKQKSDGHLFRIVTVGEGNMPSYASQVSREDRWKVIRYIRWMQNP